MNDSPPRTGRRCDRRQYVIAPRPQVGTTLRILVPAAAVSALSAVAVFLFLRRAEATVVHIADLRRFLLVAHTVYFLLLLSVLFVASLLLTHRWAGPAWVIRRAIEGMREGDFERRLELRKSDYLRDVAGDLAAFRTELVRDRAAEAATIRRVQTHLAEGDVEEAKRLVDDLVEDPKARAKERESVPAA